MGSFTMVRSTRFLPFGLSIHISSFFNSAPIDPRAGITIPSLFPVIRKDGWPGFVSETISTYTPGPPRNSPAPDESCNNSYLMTLKGTSDSKNSMSGLTKLARKELGPTPCQPSKPFIPPPLPSLANVSAIYCFTVPVLGQITSKSTPLLIGQQCLANPPMALSGIALARAILQASMTTSPTLIPHAPTVEGYFGFITVPSGAITRIGVKLP